MSRIKDLVSKGVRLIVTEEAGELPADLIDEGSDAATRTTTSPRPPRPAPREREIPPEAFEGSPPRKVAESAVPASSDFGAVYAEAGIALPGHGYGVDKVGEMLESKRLASLNREVKAAAVMAALEAAGVPVRDVVQDAVLRDKALDAFEAAKEREAREARQRNEARIASLQGELDTLLKKINTEIETLKKGSDDADRSLLALRARKQKEEERLHVIVAHFIEGSDNPVTAATPETPPAKA